MNAPTLNYAAPRSFWPRKVVAALCISIPFAFVSAVFGPSLFFPDAYNETGPTPRTTVRYLRQQISFYADDHGKPPAEGVVFTQLTHATNKDGVCTSGPPTPAFPYGPYFREYQTDGQIRIGKPSTLYTNRWTTRSAKVSTTPAPDIGWVYKVTGTGWSFKMVNANGDDVDDHY